ncbi:tape measure protein [Metapseudomonas sp. CR1201]
MAEYEIKLTADTSGATSATKEFRKEYVELVKAIERPLRQIDAFRKTQESAKAASTTYFEAKKRVDDLKRAIEQAGQPVKGLSREYAKAQQALAAATRQFERQKAQVRDQRAELKAAGVDTRNLATEQERLQKSLSSAVSRGQADAGISQLVDRFGITRLRELRAQLVALQSDYKRVQQAGVLSATERASAEVHYQAQLARTRKAIANLEDGELEGGAAGWGGLQSRMAGLLAASYTAKELATRFFSTADAVGEIEDRMRNALPVQEDYERAQARLEEISERVRVPIAAVTESFLGSVSPLREMGFSAKSAADMTAALAAGLVADRVTGERAVAVLDQLNKGLQTGVIRGNAFGAVLENSQSLINALTRGLGVSRAELISMAEAGEITTEKFVTALSSQSDELLRLADNMRVTVGDAQNTFYDKMGKLVGAIDSLTGASAYAVEHIDRLSVALDHLAEGRAADALSKVGEDWQLFNPVTGWMVTWGKAVDLWRWLSDETEKSLDEQTQAQDKATNDAHSIGEKRLSEMRAYATNFNDIQKSLAKDFKQALADQVAAQTKANSELSKARDEQLKTAKRYKDALEKLRIGALGPASFGNAQALQTAARSALKQGDFERAKKNAQAALDMLIKIGEEGGNTYGFAGIIKGLQAIEQEADQKVVDQKQKARDEARAKTREWKEEFEELKDFKITPTIDDKALADATAKMQKWAKMIGKDIKIDPRTLTPAAWHAPLLAPESTTGAKVRPQTQVQVPMALKPAKVAQDPSALPTVEANIKPNEILKEGPASFTNLPAVDADIKPKGIRQDGKNSFTNLPPVEADIAPKGIRQEGENSWTNLPPVDVTIRPKAIQQDSDTSTSLPPVDVTMKVDEKAAAIAAETIKAMSAQFRQQMTIPVPVVPVGVAASDAAAPGFSGGGWTGPGSKYMPAGVVHADEHVQPKEVVNEPGALQFLERIRHFGFRNTMLELSSMIRNKAPGYANGGLVRGGSLPSIPTPSPAVVAAAEPFAGWDDLGMVTISDGGSEFPALMQRSTFEDLTHLRARQAGRNSRRKP